MWNRTVDLTEQYATAETADLQVVLPVQRPGGEPLLRGARYAPQTAGVKGQAHERLGVGFNLAQPAPLGYIPQHQGTVLVSSHQERSGTRVWLRERGLGVGGDKREEEGRRSGKRGKRQRGVCEGCVVKKNHRNQCTVQRLSCWKLLLTLRGTLWVPFISPLRFLSRSLLRHSSLCSSSISPSHRPRCSHDT